MAPQAEQSLPNPATFILRGEKVWVHIKTRAIGVVRMPHICQGMPILRSRLLASCICNKLQGLQLQPFELLLQQNKRIVMIFSEALFTFGRVRHL